MNKPDKYKEIKAVIKQIYHENKGRYGYRRITLEMKNRGYIINHKTVLKIMRLQQVQPSEPRSEQPRWARCNPPDSEPRQPPGTSARQR